MESIIEFITPITSSFWFESIFKLLLGFILSGIIGMERSSWNKPAGFRTHSLVGISAVLIMLCGEYMSQLYEIDPSRIPAQLLSGIGFIGAGTILRDGFNVKGLTTAASLLAVTCIGLSIGAGFYLGGIIATLIIYIILSYSYKLSGKLDKFKVIELQFIIKENISETLRRIHQVYDEYDIEIKHIKRQKNEELNFEDGNIHETITIVGQYHKKDLNKNELISKLTSIETIKELIEN